jgi:hypothetical protein
METGSIREQPVRPLAHALIGALDEIAMLVARSDEPERTREEVRATLVTLLEAVRA